jgi:signal transduction histidine kinase
MDTDDELIRRLQETLDEVARHRRLLDLAVETSLVVGADLELTTLLVKLMALAEKMLEAEISSVMLVDERRETLRWAVAEGRAPAGALGDMTLALGEGIAGTVAATGEPIIVTDAEHDARVARRVDSQTGFRTRSIVCVPIRFRGVITGVIQVLNKKVGYFTDRDREMLELIAAEAGVAIENARMYGSLETRVRERTAELLTANTRLTETLAELRETQAQLVQSAKMAALGTLVAGIAHDINTPLGAVISNTDLVLRGLARLTAELPAERAGAFGTLTELLRINTEACARMSGIVKNLKTFARLDEAEWKTVDLRDGLESSLRLVEHLHGGRIEIVRDYGDVPPIACHPGQLNQVFMNLIVNAIQAIDGPGTVTLRLAAADGGVRVDIEDTGSGIVAEHLPRIFDPGFTTKGVGVGSGLGLSISHRIVAAHGGRIDVSSQPAVGSKFSIRLPLTR